MATCSPEPPPPPGEDEAVSEETTSRGSDSSEASTLQKASSNSPDLTGDEPSVIVRSKTTFTRGELFRPNPDGEKEEEEEEDDDDDDDDGDEEEAHMLPQIFISHQAHTYDERVALFCDQMIAKQRSAEEADAAIAVYIVDKLARQQSWTAVWKAAPDLLLVDIADVNLVNCDDIVGDLPSIGVLVEVNCSPCEDKMVPLRVSVSVAEPFSSNITNLPRELVEEVLKEQDYFVPILDVYPVQGLGPAVDSIAECLEHARFFYDFLWREWDDEEECEEYAGLIEKRLQLYYDTQDGTIPGPLSERYRKTLKEYRRKRQELTKFQTNIHGEALPWEAVECWKKFYDLSMICNLLKIWEELRLRVGWHGTFYCQISKRRKGQRGSGKSVTHIVAQMMTTDMIKNFSSDTLILQHSNLSAALDSCFSGDTVVVFPGEYQADALASLTDDIIIKGEGERHEVVFYSSPAQDNFVASKSSEVTLMNLTLVQHGTCNGVVVVESGQTTLENCTLKCDGTGVCVLTGASLVMRNCEIFGAQGAGVELHPGSTAELHGNEIHHCGQQAAKDSKDSRGGIFLKVLPQPQLKLCNNHIHDNSGYGVTLLVPDSLYKASQEELGQTAGGDHLSKTLQKLSLEVHANKLDANTLGDVGLQRYLTRELLR